MIKKESIFSKLEYQVVDFKNDRFAIANMDGRIIDDAQGYGYKTKQSAHKAAYFIHKALQAHLLILFIQLAVVLGVCSIGWQIERIREIVSGVKL